MRVFVTVLRAFLQKSAQKNKKLKKQKATGEKKKKDMSSTASSANSEQGERERALCEVHVTVQKVRPDAQQGVL